MPKFRNVFKVVVTMALVISTVFCMSTPTYAAETAKPFANDTEKKHPLVERQLTTRDGEEQSASEPDSSSHTNLITSYETFRIKIEEIEKYKEIPLYLQTDYPDIPYGKYGSVASHGCGLVSLWMVATYLNDTEYDINELAEQFGDYNTKSGSLWILFKDSAKELELDLIESECPNGEWYDWNMIMEALANDQPVIFLMNSNSLFTSSGHFIVLSGLTDDGKIIVNDPNGANYDKYYLKDGYENGFTEAQMKQGFVAAWIYEKKPERFSVTLNPPAPFDNINNFVFTREAS